MRKLLAIVMILILIATAVILILVFKNNGTYKVVKTTSKILGIETVYVADDYDTFDAFHKGVFDRQIVINRRYITIKANENDNATAYKFKKEGKNIVFEKGDINLNTYTYSKGRIYETFEFLGMVYEVEYKR